MACVMTVFGISPELGTWITVAGKSVSWEGRKGRRRQGEEKGPTAEVEPDDEVLLVEALAVGRRR